MRPMIGIPLRVGYSEENTPEVYMFESLRSSIQKLGGDILPIIPVENILQKCFNFSFDI